jgi:hypothetical protein
MKHCLTVLLIVCYAVSTSAQADSDVNDFLENPFDLQAFKRAKGQSNSGGGGGKDYWYKPLTKGYYYNFYRFDTEQTGFNYSLSGLKKHPISTDFGIVIDTYKPLGKYEKEYLDPTETLIRVYAEQNDEDLPELALIGLDSSLVKSRFSRDPIRKNKCFIYMYKNNILVIGFFGPMASWLRYVRLNFQVVESTIPDELLQYK